MISIAYETERLLQIDCRWAGGSADNGRRFFQGAAVHVDRILTELD
jgi:hypothetical protein